MRGRVVPCALALMVAWAAAARAAPPPPVDESALFSFPGAPAQPASAAAAGAALADRWLGDEPFDNPAAVTPGGVMLAPALVRVRRQDLAAAAPGYDQTPAFPDAGGAWLSLPVRGGGLLLYAAQPALRREDVAFSSPAGTEPGNFGLRVHARETRAGVALSWPWRSLRGGAALEWSRHDDLDELDETSGNPQRSGRYHLDQNGGGLGFQAGVRAPVGGHAVVGAALRRVPSIELKGRRTFEATYDAGLDVDEPVRCTRTATWEGGVSAQWSLGPAVRALAGCGGRGAQEWSAYGVTAGPEVSWSAAVAWMDPEGPWSARAGVGQEQQRGVPEPRAGRVGFGLGWTSESLRLEFGVLHRSIGRPGRSKPLDDRVLASVVVGF
jgi:hypothetical protein